MQIQDGKIRYNGVDFEVGDFLASLTPGVAVRVMHSLGFPLRPDEAIAAVRSTIARLLEEQSKSALQEVEMTVLELRDALDKAGKSWTYRMTKSELIEVYNGD